MMQEEAAMASKAELVKALVKFQGSVTNPPKNQVNPFHKNRYADLAGILDHIRKPLAAAGLAVFQAVEKDNGGDLILVTRVAHESGWHISSRLPVSGADSQKLGSSITYMRRYALCAILGIAADDDDDGNAAAKPKTTAKKRGRPPKSVKVEFKEVLCSNPDCGTLHATDGVTIYKAAKDAPKPYTEQLVWNCPDCSKISLARAPVPVTKEDDELPF